MTGELLGRSALITGASEGLGFAIAQKYLDEGANIFICARSAEKLSRAHAELASRVSDDRRVGSLVADVSDPEDVHELVTAAIDQFSTLSVLVNNAGIYGPKGQLETVDWTSWVRAIEINLFGSVLLAHALIPHFKNLGTGRIIQLSGGGATSPLPGLSAYAASKAAVVRFAETLALELKPYSIAVNSIAPGALNTKMLDEILEASPEQVGEAYYQRAIAQKASGGASPEHGAALAVWLASSAADGITGKLVSAIWDPWRNLSSHCDDLDSDIYTLRRIIPADRGLDWGEK